MDLLLFLDKSIILRDSSERKFVHQVDFVRVAHVLVLYHWLITSKPSSGGAPYLKRLHN